jgi:hypothetical protein
VRQPPYLPDVVAYDVEITEQNAMEQRLEIPKTEFERCFQHWQ